MYFDKEDEARIKELMSNFPKDKHSEVFEQIMETNEGLREIAIKVGHVFNDEEKCNLLMMYFPIIITRLIKDFNDPLELLKKVDEWTKI